VADELLESFKARYAFPLDDFQLRAISAILDGKSVIVSAPTGSGKTLVAEFAIHAALHRGRRIAYTTPLKALSNQKYADFGRQWGAENVGILTGDVKVNPRAPVVVMTTEILRNMFYSGGLPGLDTVVLDECHYMGDEGRGTVWEEIIVNCPKDVALVALSATVRNVNEIADWIGLVHRPIVAVTHPHRPVPLQYLVADLSGEIHTYDAVRHGKVRLLGEERDSGGYNDRGRWYTRRVVDPTVMLDELESRGWLPAIYFIFSRAGCERAMETVLAEGKPLLSREQRRQVDEAIREQIGENPTIAESPLNQTIFQALGMGVGLHHAGILPTVKRFTELLFERGLCKVVFATETMSLGIHMPAKSVVLQSLTKRTDRGFRSLTHNELTQMAGRAGRRGIDPEGNCVMALDVRDGFDDMKRVVDGPPEPVVSQFKLGYGSVALLLSTGSDLATIRRIVESSFGQYQNMKRIRSMEADVASLETAVTDGRRFEAPCGDFSRIGRYRAVRSEVEVARMARGKGGRRGRSAAEAEPGRLALVRRKSGASLGLIVGVDHRRHRNLIQVMLPHGGTVAMKEGNVKRVFWQTPPLHVPRDWEHRTRGLTEQMARLSVPELVEREKSHGPEGTLAAIECHRCPWGSQNRCEQAWKGLESVDRQLAQKREMLDAFRNAYWQEFLRVVEVLERFGAVQDAKLLAKGQLISGLRHDNELLVAEIVDRGILADTTLPEAATLCSGLIEEARSGDAAVARLFLKKRPKLKRKLQEMESVANTILEVQRRHGLPMPVSVSTGFMPSVFRWASGEDDWAAIVEESFGGHEGDLIRAMRRLIDVLRQLGEAPEVEPALAGLLARAARVIDRGIVLESALI
jgi:superfamily II RNA helicase